MPATARPGRLTVLPSGEQFEISSGGQRATIVEVGGGLREYEVDGRAVIEPSPADRMCDGAHGAPLIPWPNRLADGRARNPGDRGVRQRTADGVLETIRRLESDHRVHDAAADAALAATWLLCTAPVPTSWSSRASTPKKPRGRFNSRTPISMCRRLHPHRSRL